MRQLLGEFNTHIKRRTGKTSTWHSVASDEGYDVRSFDELQTEIAWIGYYNPSYEIFLRGQARDFRNRGSTLKESLVTPSMFRAPKNREGVSPTLLRIRLDALKHYCDQISLEKKRSGIRALKYHEVAVWALLQHYGICPTPLVDITRSARVAASFAALGAPVGDRYVYAFALPYLTGNVTYDFTNEVVLLNLRNLMPFEARRPHFQDGYLVGSLPVLKMPNKGQNLAMRMIAKFRIPEGDLGTFFPVEHPAISEAVLIPATDPVQAWVTALVPPPLDPWLAPE